MCLLQVDQFHKSFSQSCGLDHFVNQHLKQVKIVLNNQLVTKINLCYDEHDLMFISVLLCLTCTIHLAQNGVMSEHR